MLPELLPNSPGLETIVLPSLRDLVVGHVSEMAQQRVQQGWEECVGGRVGLGPTLLCISYLNQLQCGLDQPQQANVPFLQVSAG